MCCMTVLSPLRSIEAKGSREWKMEFVRFKSWEQEPIDLNSAYIPPPDTSVPSEALEAVRKIPSSGPTGRVVDLRNLREREVLAPQNPNQVGLTKGAEMAEHSNLRAGLLQSQFETTKRTLLSRSANHPKLGVKFKFPQSESCSAPGTGVYYMPRRSITSKGHATACSVEALSLLSDVSCEVKRTHIQRSCNLTPKLSESKGYVNARTIEALSLLADVSFEEYRAHMKRSCNLTPKLPSWKVTNKERFKQMPLQKKMASILKNFNPLKEYCTDQHSQKMITDSFTVVRKLRTPRRPSLPAFRCPTKLQKNISLSKCDEILSCRLGTSASLVDEAHLPDHLVMTETSAITSANKDIGEGKFPDDKSMSTVGSVPLTAQITTTLERVSISSSPISGKKGKPSGGSKRAERISNQILQFIGEMSVSERLIRQNLGNNPDTSKYLRLLLTERKVKRIGSGGKGRPFLYVATEKGLLHLHAVKQAISEVVDLTPESVSSSNPISGASIVSDAPKPEAQCLPTQDAISPEASVSRTNESQPYSPTPHYCLQWPLTQTLNCVLSSQSFDLPEASVSRTNESQPYSATPHYCLQWPLTQTLNCVLSSQSFDHPSSGINEC